MRLLYVSAVSFGFIGALLSVAARANAVTEQPFQTRVDVATLVVIATASSTEGGAGHVQYSVLKIDSVLKGSAPPTIRLVTTRFVAELNPLCCVVGSRYLLFLESTKDGSYVTVNGPFGAYLLGSKQ